MATPNDSDSTASDSSGRAGRPSPAEDHPTVAQGGSTVRRAPTEQPVVTRGSDLSTASSGPPIEAANHPTSDYAEPRFGDFRVLDVLGRGGMGVVYRALDPRRQTIVALKTLSVDAHQSLSRFKREFRALADAVHPNLVKLYELAADGPRWYFTMEYVEGESFLSYVRPDRNRPDYDRLRDALRQLAEGTAALHERRILHRDLKPSNVMVDLDGRVVVLDFGLAAEIGPDDAHLSSTPHFCGTVAYMAPEQAACLALTPACDWYSIGVILYEALTGKLPYSGSLTTVMRLKQEADPRSPRELNSDAPSDLDRLCLDLMKREPAERPTARDVLERLGSRLAGAAATTAKETKFVGREGTLGVLRDAFRSVRGGRTTAVLVHGHSGMGKSALLARFLQEVATESRAVVLSGRCYESESVPFKAVDGLVDALTLYLRRLPHDEADKFLPRDAGALVRVFPVFREVECIAGTMLRGSDTATPQELRQRAFDALRDLLGRIGDRRPLVIALDDLQWGDVDGAALLLELIRPSDRPTCLLVLAYRREDVDRSECLRTLRDDWPESCPRRDAPIDALSRDEIAAIAGPTLASLAENEAGLSELVDQIAAESRGSPFFVQELVARVLARRVDEPGASLDDVLRSRIAVLPSSARRLLGVIAVAGAPIRRADAYTAAELPAEDSAAELLRGERLLRGAPGPDNEPRLETYHDRVRETAVARLDPDSLRDFHRRLARALSQAPRVDPQSLARHYEGAGLTGPAAENFARAAALAADKLAFDHAAGLYRRACELAPDRAPEWYASLGEALANAGRGREAAEEFVKAAERSPPREALALQQKAAAQYLGSGRLYEGTALLGRMLAALGVHLPATRFEAVARISWIRIRLALRGLSLPARPAPLDERARETLDAQFQIIGALTVADPVRGQCLQSQVLLTCLQQGDPIGAAKAIAYQTVQFALTSRRVGWAERAYLARAKELAAQVKRPEVDATVRMCEGVTAYLHGSWRAAVEGCSQAAEMLQQCTNAFRWDREVTYIWELNALYFLGDYPRLAERLETVVASATARNDLHTLVNHGTFTQAMLLIADDRPEEAVHSIDALLARWSQSGFHIPHYNGLLMQTQAALYAGDLRSARERIERCLFEANGAGMTWLQIIRGTLAAFDGNLRLAEADASRDLRSLRGIDAVARRLAREGVGWALAMSLAIQAGAAHLRGGRERAIECLRRAEAEFDKADMTLHALACRRHGARLVQGSDEPRTINDVDRRMRERLVKQPAKFAAMLFAGFSRIDD